MDIERTCYTCLKKENNDLICLLGLDDDNISFLDKLSTCISIKLEYEKCMKICTVCLEQLKDAFRFITMVKITQESVTLIINNLKLESSEYNLDLDITDNTENVYNPKNSPEVSCKSAKGDCKSSQKNSGYELTEKMFSCEICGQQFDKQWKAHRHRKRMHLSEKQYLCTFCDKAFKQRYHLTEHLTIHTGMKSFRCNICDKNFSRSSSLSRHMRSHEKPHGQKSIRKPFLCPICGKKFDFENGGERHMRIHLGIKKFECNICNRRFTQSTHLSVHMRTHTGEKRYICETCGEAFSLNAGLQKHMKSHRNEVKNECTVPSINILQNIVFKT